MIFLTVGTTKFPFNRLLRAVDEAMENWGRREKLVVQVGKSSYQFKYKNREVFEEVPFDKLVYYLKKARVVITHGGAGTILLALKYTKKKPLVVPRSKNLGEHVDNHQIFFVKYLVKRRLAKGIFPEQNLVKKIEYYLAKPENLFFSSGLNRVPLVDNLCRYTGKLTFRK